MRRYTLLEIIYFDFKLWSYNWTQICRYTMYCWRHGSTEYNTKHYSERANYAETSLNFNPEDDPEWDFYSASVIPSYCENADTTHLEAVWDKSSAGQPSLKRGITVPESQQPLPWAMTVPQMQERSTIKRIHKWKRLVSACALREVMANTATDESRNCMSKVQSRMRSRLGLGDPDSVSTIPRYPAAAANQLQNQVLTTYMTPEETEID